MKIAITGGSGFVGTGLTKRFLSLGHSVVILDRRPPRYSLDGSVFLQTDLINDLPKEEFLSCDAVVHLAGANIFSRWTKSYKKIILESRVLTTKNLVDCLTQAGFGPKVFVSASAIGYYPNSENQELTESSSNGSHFLADVCNQWEKTSSLLEGVGVRWVGVRTGIVLGGGGGMLSKVLPIFRLGLGGRLGSGNQWFSWVHIEDLLNIYIASVLDSDFSGPINATSPEPVTNRDFTRILAKVLHRPAFFPVPEFALKLVLGELSEVVLMSQKVMPKKLQVKKFAFLYPQLKPALESILRGKIII